MNMIDVIAVRHAQQDTSRGLPDPSLLADPRLPEQISQVEQQIAAIVPDAESVLVAASPKNRTIESARLILATGWLQERAIVPTPLIRDAISDDAPMPLQPERITAYWRSTLDEMARIALAGTPEGAKSALVIVTHAPVIREMFAALPEADLGHPRHVGLLNVRHFSYASEQA